MLLHTVDAFTDRPFAGNPAAVTLLNPEGEGEANAPLDEPTMQAVAMEMNLSETAFLVRRADGAFDLRWFTPEVEIALCGHATLASAHVLWEQGHLAPGAEAVFHTMSGELRCRQAPRGWIEMDFPAVPVQPVEAPAGLHEALGAPALFVGGNGMDLLVRLADARAVRALRPDHARIAALGVRGVIVTAEADAETGAGFSFVSRFFAPGAGVAEDPVTGSAHCALAPYWHGVLGTPKMRAFQASRRGGVVEVEHRGARVLLRGQAVTMMECRMTLAGSAKGEVRSAK